MEVCTETGLVTLPGLRPTKPTKVAGTLRRAVRSSAFTAILGVRHMECAYYFDFGRLCHDRPYPREGELLGKTLDHNLNDRVSACVRVLRHA